MTGFSRFKATKKVSHKKAHKAQNDLDNEGALQSLRAASFLPSSGFTSIRFLRLFFFVTYVPFCGWLLFLIVAQFQKKLSCGTQGAQ